MMPAKPFKNCPKCQAEVNRIRYGDIEVEACPNCQGFFLDYADLKKSGAHAFENFAAKRRKDAEALDKLEIQCPKCSILMRKRKSPNDKEVLLDICPSCNGVWFDEGEFCTDPKRDPNKIKKLVLMLVCPDCDYEADHGQIKSTHQNLPQCPRCTKTLSFKGHGIILYKTRPVLVLLALLVLSIPAFLCLYSYFREYDDRKINPNQPIAVGEMIYDGQARVNVPDNSAMALYATSYGLRSSGGVGLSRVGTAKMITQQHAYIYKGVQGNVLKVTYEYSDSKGKEKSEDLNLFLIENTVYLHVPAIPQIKKSKSRTLEIKITDDGKVTVQ